MEPPALSCWVVQCAQTENDTLSQPRLMEATEGCSLGSTDESAAPSLNSGAVSETGMDCSVVLKVIKLRFHSVCPGWSGCTECRAFAVLTGKKTL